jgi:hypothetical protein
VNTPRLADWRVRLAAVVEQHRNMPFEFGVNDCCLFAADCVQAMTGVDPGAAHRDYTGMNGAARKIGEFGGVVGIGDTLFGTPVPVLLARVGDVGLVLASGRESLAVCNGDTWLATGELGQVALPIRSAVKAWAF